MPTIQFPYKQPHKSQPIRCLRSFINLQRDSIKLVRWDNSASDCTSVIPVCSCLASFLGIQHPVLITCTMQIQRGLLCMVWGRRRVDSTGSDRPWGPFSLMPIQGGRGVRAFKRQHQCYLFRMPGTDWCEKCTVGCHPLRVYQTSCSWPNVPGILLYISSCKQSKTGDGNASTSHPYWPWWSGHDLVSHSHVSRSESSSDLFHIEFVFDSDVDCRFTIYNFLPDSVDLETLRIEYDVTLM